MMERAIMVTILGAPTLCTAIAGLIDKNKQSLVLSEVGKLTICA